MTTTPITELTRAEAEERIKKLAETYTVCVDVHHFEHVTNDALEDELERLNDKITGVEMSVTYRINDDRIPAADERAAKIRSLVDQLNKEVTAAREADLTVNLKIDPSDPWNALQVQILKEL